ncbi:MAG: hypothetical protein WCT04_16780 [Planctomycetota bacterium]
MRWCDGWGMMSDNFVLISFEKDDTLKTVKKIIAIILLAALAGCKSTSPEHKKIEALAKRNPLDMANEDAQLVLLPKSDKKPQYPKVPTVNAKDASFVSGKGSKIYHLRSCEYVGKVDSPIGFGSSDDAERSGRLPCEFCKPRENAK